MELKYPIDLHGIFYMKINQRLRVREYEKLCKELKNRRYSVVKASEALALHDEEALALPDKVRVIWIHDIESPSDNWLAEEMAEVEARHGFSSTFNIRTYCIMEEQLLKPLRRIVKLGGEIQYQYEELVTTGGDALAARKLFGRNLAKIRRHFPKVTIAFSHGVWLSGFNNTDQFKVRGKWRPAFWMKYGIHPKGELYYFIDVAREQYGKKFHYIGESSCLGAAEFVAALRKTRPGDVVLFLQHPLWWSTIVDIETWKKCLRRSVFFGMK